MITFELLYALMDNTQCRSSIAHGQRESTVLMCPAPTVNWPSLPTWWRPGMAEKAEPQPVKAKQKLVYKYPAKKKPAKKKRKGRR